MFKWIKGTINELKATTWPTWRRLGVLVLYTVITCGIITLLILVLDLFLHKGSTCFLSGSSIVNMLKCLIAK